MATVPVLGGASCAVRCRHLLTVGQGHNLQQEHMTVSTLFDLFDVMNLPSAPCIIFPGPDERSLQGAGRFRALQHVPYWTTPPDSSV